MEARHGGVMQSHLGVQPPDAPPGPTQAQAQLWLFSGNEAGAVTLRRRERLRAHQRVSAAGLGFSDGCIPFDIAKQVVDAAIRMHFSSPSADHCDLGMAV